MNLFIKTAIAITLTLAASVSIAYTDGAEKDAFDKIIVKGMEQTNKNLPMQLDKFTTLESVAYIGRILIGQHSVDLSKFNVVAKMTMKDWENNTTIELFRELLYTEAHNELCYDKAKMLAFKRFDVGYKRVYVRETNSRFLASISINYKSCKKFMKTN